MIALIRLTIISFIVLSIFYVLIRIYSRSLRREKLEKQWVEEGSIGDRAAYVEAGMKEYDQSIRPRLIILVYFIPMIVVFTMLYVTNFM